VGGSREDNIRGETLKEWFLMVGAVVLNRDNAPTFITCRASSTIDISFVSPAIQHLCMDTIRNEPSFSDHVAIRFNIRQQPLPRVRERNLWKANLTQFASLLMEWPAPPTLWNEWTVESQSDILKSNITSALDITCSKRIIKNRTILPWWRTNLYKTRREASKAYHIHTKHPSEQNTVHYKNSRRAHYRAIQMLRGRAGRLLYLARRIRKMLPCFQKQFKTN
jgi:hypothetical protein